MQKLHFSTLIEAPREIVWKSMLEDATYRKWTASFMPGSFFKGNWNKGSKIQFLAADENGKMGGMSSEIAENIPGEYISIHHLGVVTNGKEDITSSEAQKWNGYENYSFKDKENGTELLVDVDVTEEFVDYMNEAWPKALQTLKEIAEKAL